MILSERCFARDPPQDKKRNDPKQIQPEPVAHNELRAAEKRNWKNESAGRLVVGLRRKGESSKGKVMGEGKHPHRRIPSKGIAAIERLPANDQSAKQRPDAQ